MIYKPGRRISIQPMVYTPEEVEKRLAIGDQFVEEVLTKRPEIAICHIMKKYIQEWYEKRKPRFNHG